MLNVKENLIHVSTCFLPAPVADTHLVGDLGAFGSLSSLDEEDKSDREDQQERDDSFLEGSHGA